MTDDRPPTPPPLAASRRRLARPFGRLGPANPSRPSDPFGPSDPPEPSGPFVPSGRGPALPPSRRDAIAWIAVGGIGALAVACGASSDGASPSGSTSSSPATGGGGGGPTGTGSTSGTTPGCVLNPEMTQGPYYLDDGVERRDITEGRPGAALALALTVVDAATCEPIEGAVVDVWHCDAGGIYSGFVDTSTSANSGPGSSGGAEGARGGRPGGGMPGGGGFGDDGGAATAADDSRFLRGWQRTDADGVVTFDTIYPGWYTGRAVHIHVKVHLGDDVIHTGQLFFDESQTDAVYEREPYASHAGRRLRNEEDGIFGGGGASSIVAVTAAGDGYDGALTMGVQRDTADPA